MLRRRLLSAAIGWVGLLAAAGCAASSGVWPASTADPAGGTAPAETTAPPAGTGPAPSTTTPITAADTVPTTAVAAAPARCPDGSEARCEANTAAGSAYLQARVVGGVFGFRFARLGGGVVAASNQEHPFYPASSIKAFQHLHAVRWAASEPDPAAALETPIPVYDDSCAGTGTSHIERLAEVLAAMMIDSDNRRANAVQDFFGRAAINATAAEVAGAMDTLLAHRFGCGGPANDPANRSTAGDLSRLYERVGLGEALDAGAVASFTSLMPGPLWPSFEEAVAAEGAALGLRVPTVEAFRAGIESAYKAGWWGTNLSLGGLLRLPAAPCEGSPPRAYAFAVFVDGADAVADGFDVADVVAVVLAEEIREALLDYTLCPQ